MFVCLHYVCPDDDETSTKCSPRWVVHPYSHALDGERFRTATTQQQCLDACVADTDCIAVDWDSSACWFHNTIRQRHRHPVSTHFEVVRRCNATSGMTCGVVKDFMFEDSDKYLGIRDKDLWSENKDMNLKFEDKDKTKDLGLEDKDKDFPRGQQHWVTVKNCLLTDISVSNI